MDALMKQANKIRDQVSKQQQAVLKTFSGSAAPQHSDTIVIDEVELQRHQQLERLYASTKAGKHFQREVVRGLEGMVAMGTKHLELSTGLADACAKYGKDGPGAGGALGRAAVHCSAARISLERERDSYHRALGMQVLDPLKGMMNGAPLDDARMLTQKYDRLRQEGEMQVQEVGRRSRKAKEGVPPPEAVDRLEAAEQKMADTARAMAVLGKEAAAAMSAVQAQQQRLTLQRIIAMVEAERSFHLNAAEILETAQALMISERQRNDTSPPPTTDPSSSAASFAPPSYKQVVQPRSTKGTAYFLAEVLHPFQAEGEGELSLTIGDYLVVRQVSPTGWAEGELKGRAGWFPAAYVEQRQRVPANKLV